MSNEIVDDPINIAQLDLFIPSTSSYVFPPDIHKYLGLFCNTTSIGRFVDANLELIAKGVDKEINKESLKDSPHHSLCVNRDLSTIIYSELSGVTREQREVLTLSCLELTNLIHILGRGSVFGEFILGPWTSDLRWDNSWLSKSDILSRQVSIFHDSMISTKVFKNPPLLFRSSESDTTWIKLKYIDLKWQ